jgi:hypothetical protein
LIVRGVIINQVAWFLPYVYVAIVARHLPWYIWALMAIVVTCASAFFVIRLRRGRMPGRLPRFLRRRLARESERAEGSESAEGSVDGGASAVVASTNTPLSSSKEVQPLVPGHEPDR